MENYTTGIFICLSPVLINIGSIQKLECGAEYVQYIMDLFVFLSVKGHRTSCCSMYRFKIHITAQNHLIIDSFK